MRAGGGAAALEGLACDSVHLSADGAPFRRRWVVLHGDLLVVCAPGLAEAPVPCTAAELAGVAATALPLRGARASVQGCELLLDRGCCGAPPAPALLRLVFPGAASAAQWARLLARAAAPPAEAK
ncbi:unnamed protein product, partial [Prorocentrum cordatum]